MHRIRRPLRYLQQGTRSLASPARMPRPLPSPPLGQWCIAAPLKPGARPTRPASAQQSTAPCPAAKTSDRHHWRIRPLN